MNDPTFATPAPAPGSVAQPAAAQLHKGIVLGAAGALVVAAVIGTVAWWALSPRGDSLEQMQRLGTPTETVPETNADRQALAPMVPAVPAEQAPVREPARPPAVVQAEPYRSAPPPVAQMPAQAPTRAAAHDTGVVTSVHEVSVKGEANGVGAVVGGVLGGVLGNQVGGGNGRKAMTVIGAVGGGLAGHEAQKRINATKVYNVTVRFDDGSTKTLRESSAGGWRNGDRVRVRNGVISSENS